MRQVFGKRLVAAIMGVSLLGGGLVAMAPTATADSRCNRANHTHGALTWKRTDHFLGKYASPYLTGITVYSHTNSNPVNCS